MLGYEQIELSRLQKTIYEVWWFLPSGTLNLQNACAIWCLGDNGGSTPQYDVGQDYIVHNVSEVERKKKEEEWVMGMRVWLSQDCGPADQDSLTSTTKGRGDSPSTIQVMTAWQKYTIDQKMLLV